MKSACQTNWYNYYKCNNPEEEGQSGRTFKRQSVDLRKYNNRRNLNSTTDSRYLNNAAERNEPKEYYYICNFKRRSGGECKKQRVVATYDDHPLNSRVQDKQRQK